MNILECWLIICLKTKRMKECSVRCVVHPGNGINSNNPPCWTSFCSLLIDVNKKLWRDPQVSTGSKMLINARCDLTDGKTVRFFLRCRGIIWLLWIFCSLKGDGSRKGLSKHCGCTNWAELCLGWKTFIIKFLWRRNSYDYLPWISIAAQTVISIFLNTTLLYFSDLSQTRFIEVHWEISLLLHSITSIGCFSLSLTIFSNVRSILYH